MICYDMLSVAAMLIAVDVRRGLARRPPAAAAGPGALSPRRARAGPPTSKAYNMMIIMISRAARPPGLTSMMRPGKPPSGWPGQPGVAGRATRRSDRRAGPPAASQCGRTDPGGWSSDSLGGWHHHRVRVTSSESIWNLGSGVQYSLPWVMLYILGSCYISCTGAI